MKYKKNRQKIIHVLQQAQPPSGSFVSFGESLSTTSCTNKKEKKLRKKRVKENNQMKIKIKKNLICNFGTM